MSESVRSPPSGTGARGEVLVKVEDSHATVVVPLAGPQVRAGPPESGLPASGAAPNRVARESRDARAACQTAM